MADWSSPINVRLRGEQTKGRLAVMENRVMWHAIIDLARRHDTPTEGTADDRWQASEPQFSYLSRAVAEWWVAEEAATGTIVGYARSIERGGRLMGTGRARIRSRRGRPVKRTRRV